MNTFEQKINDRINNRNQLKLEFEVKANMFKPWNKSINRYINWLEDKIFNFEIVQRERLSEETIICPICNEPLGPACLE
jgi:hypothetical protein